MYNTPLTKSNPDIWFESSLKIDLDLGGARQGAHPQRTHVRTHAAVQGQAGKAEDKLYGIVP